MSASALVAHLSTAELGQRYRAARQPIERSHLQIVWLLSQGRSEREVAAVTGYGQRWISEIVRRYNAAGASGLGDQRAKNTGARPLLSPEGEAALQDALAEPPADGGLWTGPKVAAWMTARLGRKIWPQRGWDYLQKLGYSAQAPRPRHAKAASAAEQDAFKRGLPAGWTSAAPRTPSGRWRSGRLTSIALV
jgi:transposase